MATPIRPLRLLRLRPLLPLLLLTPLTHAISLPNFTPDKLVKTNDHGTNNDNKHNPITRRSATLDLQRNPDYTPNGPAAYARALQKWGADVPGGLADSLAVMRGDGAFGFSLFFSLSSSLHLGGLFGCVSTACVGVSC
jgi:hypothetical protein